MTFTHALSTNNYGPAKFIVDASPANGTHTTIAAALTSASSGDTIFIRPGTYTENLTLKAGVSLAAFTGDNNTATVTIVGKSTFTGTGTASISNINLVTNSDFVVSITGSAASAVNLNNCNISCTNNTGLNNSASNTGAGIALYNCIANLSTTGIALFTQSSTGSLTISNCTINNTGNSTTASTLSAGSGLIENSNCQIVFSTSSTGGITFQHCNLNSNVTNSITLTLNGTGTSNQINHCFINAGAASCVSIGTGVTITMDCVTLASSGVAPVAGAGTFQAGIVDYYYPFVANTVTTTTQRLATSFTQVATQFFSSTGTYTPTAGMKYCKIECLGGGGAGGGAAATGAAATSCGAGGGSGEYASGVFSATTIGTSKSVTIGAAGTANSGAAGGNGGNTSVGSTIISANGGTGGASGAAAATANANGGAGGTGGTGGDFRTNGQNGLYGYSNFSPAALLGGAGANSQYGAGGSVVVSSVNNQGGAGNGYGAGGGGSSNYQSQSALSGGVGTKGVVIVTEYI